MADSGSRGQDQEALLAPVAPFLAHLEVERRASAHTLDAYRRDLAALCEWAAREGTAPESLDPARIRAFVAAEHRRGLAPSSLQRRLSACRGWYRWLLRLGHFKADPTAGVRAPRATRKLPHVLYPHESPSLEEDPTDPH